MGGLNRTFSAFELGLLVSQGDALGYDIVAPLGRGSVRFFSARMISRQT